MSQIAGEPEEAGDERAIRTAEPLDVPIGSVGGDQNIVEAIRVDIATGDGNGPIEASKCQGAEDLIACRAVKHLDRPLRRGGGDDGVRNRIPVDIR